ncbi:Zn-ribbon domain-containing OB-fold protein [Pseudorhodoferax sp.]|uniref:Zn-ribbon domain-containing OB-fold protein n=1 Tax=Pseudorhodoferax sp. TaxID=1993553 RepID=UPI0039E51EF9
MPEPDGLSAPFWEGLRAGQLLVQRCEACGTFQWGPEWICHACHAFSPGWQQVEPTGVIYSWTRVWHATHRAVQGHVPYLVVVVELPGAGNVRMVGNLLGDPRQRVDIGTRVRGRFEQHPDADPPYALLQWVVDA